MPHPVPYEILNVNLRLTIYISIFFFFFQAEDGIRDYKVTGVQTCALPILSRNHHPGPLAGMRVLELAQIMAGPTRSEERRVGEEGRSRGSPDHLKKKKKEKKGEDGKANEI